MMLDAVLDLPAEDLGERVRARPERHEASGRHRIPSAQQAESLAEVLDQLRGQAAALRPQRLRELHQALHRVLVAGGGSLPRRRPPDEADAVVSPEPGAHLRSGRVAKPLDPVALGAALTYPRYVKDPPVDTGCGFPVCQPPTAVPRDTGGLCAGSP